MIGKVFQPVQYEGINMLCFAYGRIGHQKEFCLDVIRKPTPCPSKNDMVSASSSTSGSMDATETTGAQVTKKEVNTSAYRDWMVVARKKKTHVNNRNREDQGR